MESDDSGEELSLCASTGEAYDKIGEQTGCCGVGKRMEEMAQAQFVLPSFASLDGWFILSFD